MASITYDGQSFLIDGRRLWLVGGTIDYARCPRDHWADRIAAAKAAGLNTITTTVVWARHETRPGQFDFTGENDLKHFISLVGQAGLYAIVRMGPYVGGEYDFGGLPPWLLTQKDIALRTANTAFLEASSRSIGAVARQIRDLQATGPTGGPIIAVQNESAWTCGLDPLAASYLGELNRYLRESGFEVPIVNANDLWQGVEGEIDTWTGAGNLLANLRQLAFVRPMQPRLVSQYHLSSPAIWGDAQQPQAIEPDALQRALAEILAAGAQYNLEPFFGGTNFAFAAGRLPDAPDAFAITNHELGGPLDEAGRPTPLLPAVRRVSMFASRFARVLSHLDHKRQPVALLPSALTDRAGHGGARKADAHPAGPAIVHLTGTQGSVAFVFADPAVAGAHAGKGARASEPVSLLLADGSVLPLYLGTQPVVWCLLDVRLAGRSQLDYCNLSAFALVGRVFVVAGPAGSPARLSINGSPLEATVPADDRVEIIEHESVVVVITADEHLGKIQVADDAVFLGAMGLTSAGEPIVDSAEAVCLKIAGDGTATELKHDTDPKRSRKTTPPPPKPAPKPEAKPAARPMKAKRGKPLPPPPPPPPVVEERHPDVILAPAPRLPSPITPDDWQFAGSADYLDGTSARFASIPGPADLGTLGASYGYGWYRIVLKSPAPRTVALAWPEAGDRVHLFNDGHDAGVLGLGVGATQQLGLHLKKGEHTLVALAENMGRFSGGQMLGEGKGLLGHALAVEPLRVGKPTLVRGIPMDPLAFRTPLFGVHKGDVTDPMRLSWELPTKRKGPVLVRMGRHGQRGLVLLNDQPVAFFDAAGPASMLIDADKLSRGANTLQLAILGSAEEAQRELAEALTFLAVEEEITAKAEWSFAKWERPTADAFKPLEKRASRGHAPAWFRATFTPPAALRVPLFVDVSTLSKGLVYVNGRNLGRYFANTAAGKHVGPQTSLIVPAPFLNPGQSNDLLIFDEHGVSPAKVRLAAKV